MRLDSLGIPDTDQPDPLDNLPSREEQYHIALHWVKNGQKTDLSGFDLSGLDLPKVDLAGARLNKASFKEANLSGAALEKAELRQVDLGQACLERATLSWADLSGANLAGANLAGANLQGANLYRNNLNRADLRGANLRQANLCCAYLHQTVLNDFTQIDDKWRLVWQIINQQEGRPDLRGVDLRGANLAGANLEEAILDGADLYGANLQGANLHRASLSRTNLYEANLDGVDLSEARLNQANLQEASLNGANLRQTRLDSATQIDDIWRSLWQSVNQGDSNLDSTTSKDKPVEDGLPDKTGTSIPAGQQQTVEALWQKINPDEVVLSPTDGRWPVSGLLMVALAIVTVLVFGFGYIFWVRPIVQQQPQRAPSNAALAQKLTPAPTATPTSPSTPLPTVILPVAPPSAGNVATNYEPSPQPAAAAALPAGATPEGMIVVTPAAWAVGWGSSVDGQIHFNDPNIHVGILSGHTYYGAIQFDLSAIPPQAIITNATLELTGLGDQNLGTGGLWEVRLLDPAVDLAWPVLTYELLRDAEVDINILPALTSAGLARGRLNTFTFGPEQLAILQRHLANRVVSFRLDGPAAGDNNFFSWDSGYRKSQGVGTQPVLRIEAVSRAYVVITSTPTPKNALTAVAMLPATPQTPTPLPPYWVTPIIVTPRPTAANKATAAYQEQLTTAEAIVYGTVTPTPLNIWTATPRLSNYVLITSTPTPANIVTAAAMAAAATKIAGTTGTYTPVPDNWVTPVIITPEPAPANAATAEFRAALVTAQAILYGTPVAIWTATPTPIFVPVEGEVATPWASRTPTPTPLPIPTVLVGKIAFLSDRSGGDEPLKDPLIYIMNPDGSNLAVLTDPTFYDLAVKRDSFSADQRFRVFVKDALRFDGKRVPAIYFYDYLYNAEDQITHFGAGLAWDPVWSPTSEQIALLSNDSGDTEVWVVNRDGSNLLRLTETNEAYNARQIGKDTFVPEVNGHPSWSPDGSQIVFWSNRSGHPQIWVMNADGSNPYSLSTTSYDDWDPVWIKYTDPPRDPVPQLQPTPDAQSNGEETPAPNSSESQ